MHQAFLKISICTYQPILYLKVCASQFQIFLQPWQECHGYQGYHGYQRYNVYRGEQGLKGYQGYQDQNGFMAILNTI